MTSNLDPAQSSLQEHWSKCAFCGAHNGDFGRPLQQHRTRCRYRGDANSFVVSTPNYLKMIEEDNLTFLPMMHAQTELLKTKRLLIESQEKAAPNDSK